MSCSFISQLYSLASVSGDVTLVVNTVNTLSYLELTNNDVKGLGLG